MDTLITYMSMHHEHARHLRLEEIPLELEVFVVVSCEIGEGNQG